ncbi:MAG: hypothetical protein Q4C55_03795 [Eubacterium sp.]|nr:hypothetical protein [Eubacterium sp.]
MVHSTISRETDKLLNRKDGLLSSFSDSESRIDDKISKIFDAPITSPEAEDPLDLLFQQAVEKASKKRHAEGEIIGYHTEEILGVEEALAQMKAQTSDTAPDLMAVESLLNQAEDFVGTLPKKHYMAARAAVDKMLLDNNPLRPKKRQETPDDHFYDALFSDDSQIDWDFLPEAETAVVTDEDDTFFQAHEPSKPEAEGSFSPLGALTNSRGTFLLFFLSLIGLSVFLAVLSPVIGRLDYLTLLVLAIFMILTLDMPFNAVLFASGAILIAYLAGYIREILTGFAQADFWHLGWFVFIPLCLISASAFVQRIYPRSRSAVTSPEADQNPLQD